MHATFLSIVLAFVEGFALIISPCILPILPIVLSGSLMGKKTRPLGIIFGFMITFTLVTLFSRTLIFYAHISQEKLRNISFVILFLLGVMMLSTFLTEQFNRLTQGLMNVGSSIKSVTNTEGGFFNGLMFGALIGIIWTPCAGPILAAVIVQVVLQQATLNSIFIVLAFAIGAGLPMFLIAVIGRKIMSRFAFFQKHAVLFRKLLGLIVIVSVGFLFYDSDASFSFGRNTKPTTVHAEMLVNALEHPYQAADISGIEAWINSPPLQISALHGKVVLIDFWTYSCINCLRTLPYLKDWYAKYHDKGFEIIGIHSPEFQFEHDLNQVKRAVVKLGISYPVALDNRFETWQRYHNEYWPAHYLLDQNGKVVYEHFGEGEYDVTENNIRFLLGMSGTVTDLHNDEKYFPSLSPETYFGYQRAEHFSNAKQLLKDKLNTYHYPQSPLAMNEWALNGKWMIYPNKIVAGEKGASIKMHFNAMQVYAVMGVADKAKPVTVKITLNGKIVIPRLQIKNHELYTLLQVKHENAGEVELTVSNPGVELYTFTFGG